MATKPDSISESQRMALFTLGAAASAGFELRAAGAGRLEILGPPGAPDDVCRPVLDAVHEAGPEILRLLRFFDDEARQGRFWRPVPAPRAPQ
jgi:hypothetical protein